MAYDLIVIGILLFSAWRGASKGMIWQLATIAGIIVCFVFAETVSVAVSPFLGIEAPLNRWVAIFGLYIVSSFAAFALARSLRGGLEKVKLDDFDRHLGGIFGLVKGVVFVLVLNFFAVTLTEQSREMVFHSQSGYYSAVLFQQISPVLPAELKQVLAKFEAEFNPNAIVEHNRLHPQASHQHESNEIHPATPQVGGNPVLTPQELDQIVSQLPNMFGADLNNLVRQAIENTSPENRQELISQLKSGVPSAMRQVATDWLNGKPAASPIPVSTQQYDQLVNEIASVYSNYPAAQKLIVDEIKLTLKALPTNVSIGVLEDWKADIQGIKPDPDPNTTAATSLDQRIAYQVSRARVAFGSLDQQLQDRIKSLFTK